MKKQNNIYPTEKETLQSLFTLLFGSRKEEVAGTASRLKSSIVFFGLGFGCVVAIIAFLILITASS